MSEKTRFSGGKNNRISLPSSSQRVTCSTIDHKSLCVCSAALTASTCSGERLPFESGNGCVATADDKEDEEGRDGEEDKEEEEGEDTATAAGIDGAGPAEVDGADGDATGENGDETNGEADAAFAAGGVPFGNVDAGGVLTGATAGDVRCG